MEKQIIKKGRKILFILLLSQNIVVAQKSIKFFLEKDSLNKSNKLNNTINLIFEQYFDDSVKIEANGVIIFNNYLKTNKQLSMCEYYYEGIFDAKKYYIFINKNAYYFCPNKKYRYYYITSFNNTIGIVASNIKREYY